MPTEPNLFAGTELSARVERAERSLIEQGARAAAARDPQLRVLTQPLGSGLAVWAGPGSPFDKVVGVGMDGEFSDQELAAVEQEFADRDTPVQFEVSTLADPAVVERLTRRGYVLVGFENVLGLRLAPGRQANSAHGVEIAPATPAQFDTWLQVCVDGFATPDTQGVPSSEEFPRESLEHAMGDLAATTGFSRLIAQVDGVAAGSASLRLHDGIAQLCGASTLPAFRRRGIQASLLAHRLATAAAAGCDLATVTVLPGSKSQQNVQRLGFQLLYVRTILVKA
ncbi:GNAT family N-acetyltransferase [Nocardia altamirensis]|uniref:GNAT family N-acetyltransferase n=1 Tax=Nocardia altamirensis TaxID=472158 RepID=UPI00084007D1|nr:GNAT family N-acetyltransferase [Nocardia altamirensis]